MAKKERTKGVQRQKLKCLWKNKLSRRWWCSTKFTVWKQTIDAKICDLLLNTREWIYRNFMCSYKSQKQISRKYAFKWKLELDTIVPRSPKFQKDNISRMKAVIREATRKIIARNTIHNFKIIWLNEDFLYINYMRETISQTLLQETSELSVQVSWAK